MSRRSGGSKVIIGIVGHPFKKTCSEKWARQMGRRGLAVVVDLVCYWKKEGDAFFTHVNRELEEAAARERMVWRLKQSGYCGPMVVQGERHEAGETR